MHQWCASRSPFFCRSKFTSSSWLCSTWMELPRLPELWSPISTILFQSEAVKQERKGLKVKHVKLFLTNLPCIETHAISLNDEQMVRPSTWPSPQLFLSAPFVVSSRLISSHHSRTHTQTSELCTKGLVLLKALRECLFWSLRANYTPAVLAYADAFQGFAYTRSLAPPSYRKLTRRFWTWLNWITIKIVVEMYFSPI
jgi:hypothetical protein